MIHLPLDLINGAFEIAGAALQLVNVRQLVRQKQVRGVHWGSTALFTLWGFWNCLFFPEMNLWYSLAGAVFLLGSNILWVGLALYFERKDEAKPTS